MIEGSTEKFLEEVIETLGKCFLELGSILIKNEALTPTAYLFRLGALVGQVELKLKSVKVRVTELIKERLDEDDTDSDMS